jgi:hypothetical protein
LIDNNTRRARNTDSTRLSCDSILRADRALDAYNSTADRKSARKNVAHPRVNQAVKKICAMSLKKRLARSKPTRIERIGPTDSLP